MTEKSRQLFEEAQRYIPGGVNSPVRSFRHIGIPPIYFQRGEGAYLFDVDGNRYVDFCLSFGPHLFGHTPKEVVDAIREQAGKATSFGACHPKEVDLARWIIKAFPFAQRVRLVNSGTEATMTAVRLARGFTNRSKIIQFEGCYHGHSDGFLAKAGSGVAMLSESSSKGVPQSIVQDTLIARFDDLSTAEAHFRAHGNDIAAIILEPIPANHGLWVPSVSHLKAIVDLARRHGAVVIFDEVISGFRVGVGGASAFFDIQPDLVTLGKVIGGGLPMAAIAGKKEIMDGLAPVGSVYQAGTLSGNPLAVAAGCAVMEKIFGESPYAAFEFACTAFTEGLRECLAERYDVQIRRVGSIFWLHFGPESKQFPPEITADSAAQYREFFKKLLDKGIYFPPSPYEVCFLSSMHTPEVLGEVLDRIKACVA